jgi:hypothetical protein
MCFGCLIKKNETTSQKVEAQLLRKFKASFFYLCALLSVGTKNNMELFLRQGRFALTALAK